MSDSRQNPSSHLEQILKQMARAESDAEGRAHWAPEVEGEIDIRIASDGRWFHEGRVFERQSLVRLFAGILRREGDRYFLVTPVEKLRIQVDDAPFIVTDVEQATGGGEAALVFRTNIDEEVVLDEAHPLRVVVNEAGEPRPYILVRAGLEALLTRAVFHRLVAMAETIERPGQTCLQVSSRGDVFEIGCVETSPDDAE